MMGFENMEMLKKANKIIYILLIIFCLTPIVSSALALFMGITFALLLGNPYQKFSLNISKHLLKASIIGLGGGINLTIIAHEGLKSIPYTIIGILGVIFLGLLLGKLMKIESKTSLLITVGTAICGGSAIAAVSTSVRACSHEISVALATVFFLNAIALFVFPPLGHYFELSQLQFGLWSALAIHDTSSVVGAAMQYGSEAVDIATTVKLVRALWIIPLALIISLVWNYHSRNQQNEKPSYPIFIFGFVLASALVTCFPVLKPLGDSISHLAKQMLVLTLFLIGSTLSRETVVAVGFKPFLQGVLLWVIMGAATLAALLLKWIA